MAASVCTSLRNFRRSSKACVPQRTARMAQESQTPARGMSPILFVMASMNAWLTSSVTASEARSMNTSRWAAILSERLLPESQERCRAVRWRISWSRIASMERARLSSKTGSDHQPKPGRVFSGHTKPAVWGPGSFRAVRSPGFSGGQ